MELYINPILSSIRILHKMSTGFTHSHQDWTQVTLKPKKATTKPTKSKTLNNTSTATIEKKINSGKNTQGNSINAAVIERKLDEGELPIPKISAALKAQISQARQEKGWTQKQLAAACNLTENLVKDYENGKAVPKTNELTKMSKALGVSLKNK